jgi:hypothetical protein
MRTPFAAQEPREPHLRKVQQGCKFTNGRLLEAPFLGSQDLVRLRQHLTILILVFQKINVLRRARSDE